MSADTPTTLDVLPSFHEMVEAELKAAAAQTQPCHLHPLQPVEVLARLLPQFEQFEFLGEGGMGVVYKAWHRELRRWAAVKLLAARLATDPRALARFQNEATLLGRLRHPNIVPVHDFVSTGDLAWLVMDYVDGVPLQSWARERGRTAAELAVMVGKIARAAGVAHASGITHRDMKPGNVLVVGDEPVLLDFGLAQTSGMGRDQRLTLTGELLGTVAYLAPEQVDPALGEPGPATDVHACGVILYELLTGSLPRTGRMPEILAALAALTPAPRLRVRLPQVARNLEIICGKALECRPQHRYTNGTALAEDLQRFLEGRPVTAKPPDLLETSWRTAYRHPRLVAGLVVMCTVLALATWDALRTQTQLQSARLTAQINHELAAADWTVQRHKTAHALVAQLQVLDSTAADKMHVDLLSRTEAAVSLMLDAPRLTNEDMQRLQPLLALLKEAQHPEVINLENRCNIFLNTWQPMVQTPELITKDVAAATFEPGPWYVTPEGVCLPPRPSPTKNYPLVPLARVSGDVQVGVTYGPGWQAAERLQVSFSLDKMSDITCFIVPEPETAQSPSRTAKDRTRRILNLWQGGSVLASVSLSPESLAQRHLHLEVTYQNGVISAEVNGRDQISYLNIFQTNHLLSGVRVILYFPESIAVRNLHIQEINTSNELSTLRLADNLVEKQDFKAALDRFAACRSHHRDGTEASYKHAYCLYHLGHTERAFIEWQELAQHSPDRLWRDLSLYQLWQSNLTQGQKEIADGWFDLLTATPPHPNVTPQISKQKRVILTRYYSPMSQGLNCLRPIPAQLAEVERALRVERLLAGTNIHTAGQHAMFFHFAGQDQRARQMLAEAVSQVDPALTREHIVLFRALLCLDLWSWLGGEMTDPLLKVLRAKWQSELTKAPPSLHVVLIQENARRGLNNAQSSPATLDSYAQQMVRYATDDSVMPRHRLYSYQLAALAYERLGNETQARQQRQAALTLLNDSVHLREQTQQLLIMELITRCQTHGWDATSATEWLSAELGQIAPMGTAPGWLGSIVQSLSGPDLAEALNPMLDNTAGQKLMQNALLRKEAPRVLAPVAMALFVRAILAQGTGIMPKDRELKETSQAIVSAYQKSDLTEIELMQFFNLWSGQTGVVTWRLLGDRLPADLRIPLLKLLAKRALKQGRLNDARAFQKLLDNEKPAPVTTRVSQ